MTFAHLTMIAKEGLYALTAYAGQLVLRGTAFQLMKGVL